MEALGRDVRLYVFEAGNVIKASALVVIDRTLFGFSTWEIPRGPLLSDQWAEDSEQYENFLEQILKDAQKERCIIFYCSPLHPLPTGHWSLITSKRYVHCEATRIIDLTESEESLLAQMHQKGRYNIRVAQKHEITVKQSDDIDAFYTLLGDTGTRDGFTIHPKLHYKAFLQHLRGSFLLLAFTKDSKPIAGLLGVIWDKKGIYYYGASSYASRALMAPYLVQWEAMRHCKTRGCKTYDLLGIAPHSDQPHPWGGMSAFKEKFGGKIVTYPPEQQIVLRPWIAKMLRWKRKTIG